MIDLSLDELAQGLHVALGALFVTFPLAWVWTHPVLTDRGLWWSDHAQVLGSGVGVFFALVKEFWFDVHYEDPQTSGGYIGGLKDFVYYCVGIATANLLLLI